MQSKSITLKRVDNSQLTLRICTCSTIIDRGKSWPKHSVKRSGSGSDSGNGI